MSTYTKSAYTAVLPSRQARSGPKTGKRSVSYGKPKSKSTGRKKTFFAGWPGFSIAPGKVIFWSMVIGVAGFIYITHVFTTQNLLQDVNEVRLEYDKVRSIHETRVLDFEQITGPAAVFSRARELGYEQSGPADYIIIRGE